MTSNILSDAPEVSTQEDDMQDVSLGGTLTLTCSFEGVPTPTVSWTQNNTNIDESDPRVTFTTATNLSTITIINIGRDGGGVYGCVFNNSQGTLVTNVSTIRILSKFKC